MRFVKYRIKSPTIALLPANGRDIARTVPEGSIVTISDSLLNENKLVEVTWHGTAARMFAQDVRARGEEVAD